MPWKGWEDYAPPAATRPASPDTPGRPRVRGYRPAWVHERTLALTTEPQNGPGWQRFASTREARRYVTLSGMARLGQIRQLERQVRIPLYAPGPDGPVRIGHYVADFTYEEADGQRVIEDAKGHRTDLYRWKKRHVEAQLGLVVRET